MISLLLLILIACVVEPLVVNPPSGVNPVTQPFGWGRESDHLYLGDNLGDEWLQFPAPQGGYMWNQYQAFTDISPAPITGVFPSVTSSRPMDSMGMGLAAPACLRDVIV
jgi:hypothetical protein